MPLTTEMTVSRTGVQHLRANQPLFLSDPDVAWILESGSLVVFGCTVLRGSPEGTRRFLFTARPGDALLGTSLGRDRAEPGLLAVAVKETVVREMPLADLERDVAEGDAALRHALERWVGHLGQILVAGESARAPMRVSEADDLSLPEGEFLCAERDAVAWVSVLEGSAFVGGGLRSPLGPDDPPCPLGPELWISTESGARVEVLETPRALRERDGSGGLSGLHRRTSAHLDRLDRSEREREVQRLRDRSRQQAQETEAALQDLASVLDPTDVIRPFETPLLTTAAVVGRELDFDIKAPAKSENMARVADPLDAIARASRVRVRRVLLRGDWWRYDSGPLLAFRGEDEATREPVALVRRRGDYWLFDPVQRSQVRLDARLREELHSEAYSFFTPLPEACRGVLELVKFGLRGRSGDLWFIGLVGIAVTVLGMVVPQATAVIMDKGIPDASRGLIVELGIAMFAAAIGSALFSLAQGTVTVRLGVGTDYKTQSAIWDRLLRLRPSFFRQYSTGDLQNRVFAVSEVGRELNGATLKSLITGFMALLNLALLFYYRKKLAYIAIVVGILAMAVTYFAGKAVRKTVIPLQSIRGAFFGMVVQMVSGVARIRVAGAEFRAFTHWVARYTEQLRLILKAQRIQDRVGVFNQMLPVLASMGLFWMAVRIIMGPEPNPDLPAPLGPPKPEDPNELPLTTGIFIAFNAAFAIFIRGATEISNTVVTVLDGITKGQRIKPLLEAEPEVPPEAADPGRLRGRLELADVTFRYREDGPIILNGVSLHAEPGEFIALVGGSGCGKSTILRLLLGFETPESGAVRYDGQDLAGLDVLAVRRQIGVVLQSGRVNAGPIFDNIAAASRISFDEAWEAAADAGFADDIRAMPMEMHTVVSEGGTNLSGGQRQRLLIARALAVRPKIIFFDEATSALDNRTQSIVSESLDRRRVTRVVIAHRLSTIESADRIYVFEKGCIAECGTYQELKSQGELFSRLIARQSA